MPGGPNRALRRLRSGPALDVQSTGEDIGDGPRGTTERKRRLERRVKPGFGFT